MPAAEPQSRLRSCWWLTDPPRCRGPSSAWQQQHLAGFTWLTVAMLTLWPVLTPSAEPSEGPRAAVCRAVGGGEGWRHRSTSLGGSCRGPDACPERGLQACSQHASAGVWKQQEGGAAAGLVQAASAGRAGSARSPGPHRWHPDAVPGRKSDGDRLHIVGYMHANLQAAISGLFQADRFLGRCCKAGQAARSDTAHTDVGPCTGFSHPCCRNHVRSPAVWRIQQQLISSQRIRSKMKCSCANPELEHLRIGVSRALHLLAP